MTSAEIITCYESIKERCKAVGLAIKIEGKSFEFNIREADGLIIIHTLDDLERFVRGYELGYMAPRGMSV